MDKIYSVIDISFFHMTAKARETNLSLADVSKEEVFNLTDLEDFKITLVNDGGQAKVISINEWKKTHLGR